MRGAIGVVAVAVALGLGTTPAHAVDQLLTGTRLVVRDTGNRSRIIFLTKDPTVAVGTGANAPTVAGMQLELRNPLTAEAFVFDLPARFWSSNRFGTKYVYRDRRGEGGLVRKAVFRNGRLLRVVVDSTGISLDEPSQISLAVVAVGGDQRYCTLFADASVRRDVPCKFVARRSARPIACPAQAIGGSPSGAFLVPASP